MIVSVARSVTWLRRRPRRQSLRRGRRAAAHHRVEAVGEPSGEHVVVELATARRRASRPPIVALVASSSSRAPSAAATAAGSRGSIDDEPGRAGVDRLEGAARASRDCGTPHAAASRKTMPNPSCSSPPTASGRAARTRPRRRAGRPCPPRSRDRGSGRRRVREPRGGEPAARRGRRPRRRARGRGRAARPRDRLDEHVDALARHEPADRGRRAGASRAARAARAGRARSAASRARSGVRRRPGGTCTTGGAPSPASRRASSSG